MRKGWTFLVASAQRFHADNCFLRASALAYVSLLSLVPLLAVMFAVLKGLGVERRLEPILLARLSLHPDTTAAIMEYIDRTNFGALGVLGGVALLLTVYSLLNSVEASFSHIWRVSRARTYAQQLTQYFGVVLLTPFLLLAAVALTSSLQVNPIVEWVGGSGILGDAVMGVLGSVPMVMNIVALAVFYAVMPNRRPFWPSVLLGAVAAGIGWHVVQLAYLRLQIGVAGYNAIYAAMAQLPVTLVWQYVSWLIVLAGAELAVVYELGAEAASLDASRLSRRAIALELLVRSVRTFRAGALPVPVRDVARELRAPLTLVTDVAGWLVERGWLAAVQDRDGQYVLAVDSQHIRLGALAELLETTQPPRQCCAEVRRIWELLAAAQQTAWDQWSLADALISQREEPPSAVDSSTPGT